MPPPASEPPPPEAISSADELYITGLHLSQYRHATRSPVAYWKEALRRDPGDSRCNTALGTWHLKRGEFAKAEAFLRAAIERLMRRNPNPRDGEAYYQLGLALRFQNRDEEARAAFHKAAWNQAWRPAAFHALAEIDATKKDWRAALEHLDGALRLNTGNLRARDLRALVLRQLGRDAEAGQCVRETLKLDPLDWWARCLAGDTVRCDNQTRIDIALDFAAAGFIADAVRLLEKAEPETMSGTAPMLHYYKAAWLEKLGRGKEADAEAGRAAKAAPDYCFPARLEDIAVLQRALERNPRDARAAYYLGNLFYDRRRYDEAIALWEKSARVAPDFPITWRNLGIAYFNVQNAPAKARRAYGRAVNANPADARLLHERDQLWKRLGVSASARLREFERRRELVGQRDDATIELCALYNQTGQPGRALEIISTRKFQPWEGGEGQALAAHVRTHLALGKAALRARDAETAVAEFTAALNSPENLGETRHLLANQSDAWFWLGEAFAAAGHAAKAKTWWRRAAGARGDFQEMSVKTFSEMTCFSARALERLGKRDAAKKLFTDLAAHARGLAKQTAKIDYFATSLPTMLLFDDDLAQRQKTTALFLQAQAAFGLGRAAVAKKQLAEVLRRDPSHAAAADLMAEL
jgi:tetratricopeptide (TPR) repeat protein